jgi:hypothetical protein
VENELVWVFALCGYSTVMTRYRAGEVLEMQYYWREGSANAKLVFSLGSGEHMPGSSRQPTLLASRGFNSARVSMPSFFNP